MDPAERARVTQLLYQNRRNVLDQMMGDVLIEEAAKAAGLPVDEYQKQEIGASALQPVTDADISSSSRRTRIARRAAPIEQLQGPIRDFLAGQRQQQARAQLVDDLKKKSPASRAARSAAADRRSRRRRSGDGTGDRAGHARRVLGLSVTVLREGRSDPHEAPRDLRRQGPHRVQGFSAAEPRAGAEGGRGRALRRRAGQVLGDARSDLREPADDGRAGAEAARGGAGPRYGEVRPVPRLREVRRASPRT